MDFFLSLISQLNSFALSAHFLYSNFFFPDPFEKKNLLKLLTTAFESILLRIIYDRRRDIEERREKRWCER